MRKIKDTMAIVCSDLHICNYQDYKPNKKQMTDPEINPLGFKKASQYRRNQIMMIAYRIIYECRKRETHTVFILGDLLHKPNASPSELYLLMLFINTITSNDYYPITVYYILGQHDLLVRTSEPNLNDDTYIGTIKNNHFIYAHGNQYRMGKHVIEFRNFCFDSDTCKYSDDTTVGLGHISLGFGQSPAGKSLQLCVAGDIHDYVDKKINGIECHSCMTPFPIYPHQAMNHFISVLDCSEKVPVFKRIDSSGQILFGDKIVNYKVFDILQSDDYKKSILNDMIEQKKVSADDLDDIVRNFSSVNVSETVRKISSDNGYDDLLSEISCEPPKPVDFNFQLISLDIENFRSIDKMSIDFRNLNGISKLSGKNGSGKSSVILAIQTALEGDNHIRSFIRKGESNLLLDLSLSHSGNQYRIIRHASKTEFYKNEEKYNLTKRETEQKILDELPFIEYMDYFICHANAHFFENVDRTDLITNIFNLSSINAYRESIEQLQKRLADDIKQAQLDKKSYEGSIESLEDTLEAHKKSLEEMKKAGHIDDAKKKLDEIKELSSRIQSSEQIKASLESEKKRLEDKLRQYPDDKTFNAAKKCLSEIEDNDKVLKMVSDKEHELKKEKTDLQSLINLRKNLIESPKCTCPKCGHEFYVSRDIEKQAQDYSNMIAQKQKDIESSENEIDFIRTGIKNLDKIYTKDECNDIISKHEAIASLKANLDETSEKLRQTIDDMSLAYNSKSNILKNKSEEDYVDELNESIKHDLLMESTEKQIANTADIINNKKIQLAELDDKLSVLEKKHDKCEGFKSMFDMKNLESIPYKIIDKVLHSLDNNHVRFISTKELANGEDRFEINAEIKVGDQWISYDSASDGQKILLDSFILYSVLTNIGKVGLLIFDEYMANADNDNVDFVSSVIAKMKKFSDNIFITSHSDYFNKYDNELKLRLKKGVIKIDS